MTKFRPYIFMREEQLSQRILFIVDLKNFYWKTEEIILIGEKKLDRDPLIS